jgi:hypothetical protein
MTTQSNDFPNTLLGEVHWYSDMHFGTLLWVCQGMLGLRSPKEKDLSFLNTQKYNVSDLFEFFQEIELPNGMLGLELFMDQNWHIAAMCEIQTTLPYGETLSDQDLLNLIQDFKEFVSSLPLAEPGEGRMITDPNEPGYFEESNQEWLKDVSDMNAMLGSVFEAVKTQLHSEGIEVSTASQSTAEDDIPF